MNKITTALANGSLRNSLIQSGFGNEKDRERITKRLISLITTNTALTSLDPISILNVVIKMETMGVSPELETAYIVPYSGKAQFQLGYKGYVQLSMNTGLYKKIDCIEVKENDIESFDLLTNTINWNEDNSKERFNLRKNEKTIGWRAFAISSKDNSIQEFYMSEEEIITHLKTYSKAYSGKEKQGNVHNGLSGVQMRRKTVLKLFISRQLVKSMSLNENTTILKEAIKFDSTLIENGKPVYVDNPNEFNVFEFKETIETKKEVKGEKDNEK